MPEPKPPRFLFVSMVLFLSVETPVAAEPTIERPLPPATSEASGASRPDRHASTEGPTRKVPQLLSTQ